MTETNAVHNVNTHVAALQQARKAFVKTYIAIGAELAADKKHYEKKLAEWENLVQSKYGCKPSEASQLIEISNNLGPHVNTPEFDQSDLPNDYYKLVWLSRLSSIDQIKEVLGMMDCNTCPAKQIMAEVQERLAYPLILEKWDDFQERAVKHLYKMTPEVREQLKEELAARFDELAQLIDNPPEAEDEEVADEEAA